MVYLGVGVRNNSRADSREEHKESFKALEVLYLSYFGRLSSKISPIISPIPLAQATFVHQVRSLFPLSFG